MPSPSRAIRWGLVAVAFGLLASFAAGPAARPVRQPWTTSRVVGSPDPPPPFKVVRAFPKLKFHQPLLMARPPKGDRLFVGEQAGVLYSFPNRPWATAELFFDLRKELRTMHMVPGAKAVEALYGLAFHPDFETNRQCFVFYTLRGDPRGPQLKQGSRLSRFTVTRTDPPRIDPASEELVLSFLGGGHNGGDLHFGNDGLLYISTGDGAGPNPPDPLNTGQDISDLLSSILRIDVNRKDRGRHYAVPRDNPFVGMKGAAPEVWAYGFRNPWRMSFDRKTGALYVGDVGWQLWEMVYRVEKGGNYGWSATEGPQPVKPEKVGPTPILPPLIELPHTVACSVTGGLVYRGRKFPELVGAYVFGDWETRRLWAARFAGDRTKEMPEIARPSVRIVAFGEDADGELYFLDHDHGTVHTIERNDERGRNTNFPTKLSATGLFASVKDHRPAAGVVPYAVNSRQWQDGATAEYLVALPGRSAVTLHPPPGKPVPGLVYWHNFRMHFPKDAVLVRTLSLAGRRVETQLLHFEGADWRAYTYAWRDDQADADLVPADGTDQEVPAPGGGKRLWQFHSRSQCMLCHNNHSGYALTFQPEQLNRPGPDGRNQLVALSETGHVRRVDGEVRPLPPFDAGAAGRERKLADPNDASQPLAARARAYLHANCGHCHSEHGGGSVPLRLHANFDDADMRAVDARPVRGDFGLPDARIVKPGDPWSSTLYFRMAKFGRDRMPHLGADQPDEAGLRLIERWIAGLGKAAVAPPERPLDDPRAALVMARKLGRGELKGDARAAVLAEAAKLPTGVVRDLYEGYFPSDGKPRKLGSSPRPRTILALKGDAGRGEKLYWSAALKCGSCHKVGERGTAVGPDLSAIGKQRSREDLLDSILEPSRRIEPKFASYLVRTAGGQTHTGLLVRRNEKEVVLRDAENREVVLPARKVEEVRPSPVSLMPQGQLAGLTAQEAADLLEYVASRR